MSTISKSMDIFLSFFDYFHRTWAEILVIANDRPYWFYCEDTSHNASLSYSEMALFWCEILLFQKV